MIFFGIAPKCFGREVGGGGRQSVFVFVILECDAGAAGKHGEESTKDDDDDHDGGEDDPDE